MPKPPKPEPPAIACLTCPNHGQEHMPWPTDGGPTVFVGSCRERSPVVSDRVGSLPMIQRAAYFSGAFMGEHPYVREDHWCGKHPAKLVETQTAAIVHATLSGPSTSWCEHGLVRELMQPRPTSEPLGRRGAEPGGATETMLFNLFMRQTSVRFGAVRFEKPPA